MIYYANNNQRWTGVAALIENKIDFKIKIVTRDKKVAFYNYKKSIYKEYITIISLYAHKRIPKYMMQKQTELKREYTNQQ